MDHMCDTDQIEVGDVFRTIFLSCDPEGTNSVNVSKLIEYIRPFLLEDLNALEDLRSRLDPEGTDILVNANKFYEIIGQWSQKLSSTSPESKEDEFNQSARRISTAPEDLPYIHSTPRTSLGDKLLKCKDLLNMSNVSGYSLSTSHCEPGDFNLLGTETTQLEEQKRELEHQLSKISHELVITKQMLKSSEEQVERLQEDLGRVNRRLQEEQHVIEQLQKSTNNDEDVKEEMNKYKRYVAELKAKLADLEQDNAEFRKLVEDVEKEKLKVERQLSALTSEHETCLMALSDITVAMDNMKKVIDEKLQEKESKLEGFERCFKELQDVVEMLDEKNSALLIELAKCKTDKSVNCAHSNLEKDQCSSEEDLISKMQEIRDVANTSNGLTEKNGQQSLWAEMSKVDPRRYSAILNDTELFEKNEQIVELEYKLDHAEKQLIDLKAKNAEYETRDAQLQLENDILLSREVAINEQVETLQKEIAELRENGREKVLCKRIAELNLALQDKEALNSELKSLRNELEALQRAMGEDLTEISLDDLEPTLKHNQKHLNQTLELLQTQKTAANEKLSNLAASTADSKEIDDLKTLIEQLLKQNQELNEENFTLKKNVEFMTLKCHSLKKKIASFEEKNAWAYEVESEKNRSLEARERYEKELLEYKETVEKKVVADFENKLKQSLDSEERIFTLTQTLSEKTQALKEAENRIEALSNRNRVLQKEIVELHETKNQLEIKLLNQETQNTEERAKITKMSVLHTDITRFVKNKNRIIDELKAINMTLECNLNEAHSDVKQKIESLWEMQGDLAKGVEVKNELWRSLKSMEKDLCHKISEMNQLETTLGALGQDYSNLLMVHDLEVQKNATLAKQVEELSRQLSESNEETGKLHIVVAEQEAAVARIQKEYKSQQKKLKKIDVDSQTVLDDIPDLLNELQAKLNQEMDKNKQLTEDLLEVQSNYSGNVKQLEEMKQKLEDTERDMTKRIQEHLDKYLEKDLEIKQTIKQLQDNLELANRDLEVTKESLEDKNMLLTDVEDELLSTKRELKDLASEKDKELARIEAELEKTREELALLLEQNADLKEANDFKDLKLQESVIELQDSNTKLVAENDQLKQKLNDTREQLEFADLNVQELAESVTQLQDVNGKLVAEDEKLKQELREQAELASELMAENEQLKEKLSEMDWREAEKQKLEETLSLQLAENAQLKQTLQATISDNFNKYLIELNSKKVQIEDLQSINNSIKEELDHLHKENEALKAEAHHNKELQTQLREAKRENDTLHFKLKEYEARCVELEAKISSQTEKLKQLQSDLEKVSNKTKTYSKQQFMIEKLKEQVEDLTLKLNQKARLCEELTAKLAALEATRGESATLDQLILDKRMELEVLELQVREGRSNVTVVEDRLSELEVALRNVQGELKERSGCVCGQDVGEVREAKPINKFTIPSQFEESDLSCHGLNSLSQAKLPPCTSNSVFRVHNESSCVEVPSIDVKGFTDIIEELDLTEHNSSLSLRDLEEKVTALTLRLITNSDTITKRIESHTEKYRCQYEKAVTLISDISYRLRDHVCIGTSEPIGPVFILLEEVKRNMSNMIQDAGQVGALICEHRMWPCWNLFVNYSAALRQETEALTNVSRESTPTQTGTIRRRSNFTQNPQREVEDKLVQRSSRLGRCSKFCIVAMLVGFVAVAAGLLINLNCRLSASQHQHCPLDGLAQRISNGFPPM